MSEPCSTRSTLRIHPGLYHTTLWRLLACFACELYKGDFASDLGLILGIEWELSYDFGPQRGPLGTLHLGSDGLERVGTKFDSYLGIGKQVVVPGRIELRAATGSDDEEAVTN